MSELYKTREELLNTFGDTIDESEQEKLDELDKQIDALKEAYDQYETTLDEAKDMEEQYLEQLLAIQTEYYNMLNEELEVNLTINEDSLETIEYYLGKIADDFYKMAEGAAYLVGSLVNGEAGGQLALYLDNLKLQ
jgi:predicted ribosome quality control (RQC) complex YloA/Tae2 family protein